MHELHNKMHYKSTVYLHAKRTLFITVGQVFGGLRIGRHVTETGIVSLVLQCLCDITEFSQAVSEDKRTKTDTIDAYSLQNL